MSTSPESDLPEFQRQQLAFTAHIRDPENSALPDGIPARRMGVYTELFFNYIEDQLSTNFPILREITSDERWHAMVRDFMIRHRCQTPLFTEVGQEFLEYLQQEREPRADDWPFMLELAHYEYVELAIYISDEDDDLNEVDPNGDLLDGRPVIAAAMWNLSYQWPVHQIGADHIPDEPPTEPTHLVVYRDRLDEVHFLQINAVTQRLLQLLKENPTLSGLDVLKMIAEELAHPDTDTVVKAGADILDDLRQRNVILGSRT